MATIAVGRQLSRCCVKGSISVQSSRGPQTNRLASVRSSYSRGSTLLCAIRSRMQQRRIVCEVETNSNKEEEKAEEVQKVVPPPGTPIPPSEPEAVATTVLALSLGMEPKLQSGPFSFKDIMAFGGLAPEITNGRVAMASYSIILLTEQFTGKGIAEQLASGGWIGALAIPLILTVASIVPLAKGFRNDDWPGIGPFTAKAERWNSRACMFALTVLAIVEAVKGGPEVGSGAF